MNQIGLRVLECGWYGFACLENTLSLCWLKGEKGGVFVGRSCTLRMRCCVLASADLILSVIISNLNTIVKPYYKACLQLYAYSLTILINFHAVVKAAAF